MKFFLTLFIAMSLSLIISSSMAFANTAPTNPAFPEGRIAATTGGVNNLNSDPTITEAGVHCENKNGPTPKYEGSSSPKCGDHAAKNSTLTQAKIDFSPAPPPQSRPNTTKPTSADTNQ